MGLSFMDYEEWQSSATKRFQKDVAHYQISDQQVALWRRNIEDHPLTGTLVQGIKSNSTGRITSTRQPTTR